MADEEKKGACCPILLYLQVGHASDSQNSYVMKIVRNISLAGNQLVRDAARIG